MSRKLAFVIHDLNPWGGQDKSTLEIVRHLSTQLPLQVDAFTFEGHERIAAPFKRVFPHVKRPVLIKSSLFYASILLRFAARGKDRPLIHATGACSLISDVVQTQFVHARWKEVLKKLSINLSPYHKLMLAYNSVIERKVYTKDKTYIAISRNVAHDLERFFGIRDKIHVIHHGVDSEAFRPLRPDESLKRSQLRSKLGIGEDEVVAVFAGAYERKGLAVAIEALALLSQNVASKTRLVAVGGGDAGHFQALAKKLNVADRVLLIGHTKDVVSYYQMSDIFLLPTLYEAFGLVILEAMACGLAPIISQDAGASELCRNGESGLLIQNPESAKEVAAHWQALLTDDKMRTQMAKAARAVAVARPWSKVAAEYEQVLKPLL